MFKLKNKTILNREIVAMAGTPCLFNRQLWRGFCAIATGAGLSLALAACGGSGGSDGSNEDSSNESSQTEETPVVSESGAYDKSLAFDSENYSTIKVSIDGEAIPVRWYKEVCYVSKPVAIKLSGSQSNAVCGFQSMNIYVPESVAVNQETAIYFGVNNSGWMNSYVKASVADGQSMSSSTSQVAAALKSGYIYIDVGTRGRGLTAVDASYPGKAPAVVVDAKAAVRYLRLNDAVMPGSAERIVVNGTSGGGGLVSILGASGNSDDYVPFLDEVGAAGVSASGSSTLRDDVLAVVAYCPITDLGNADLSYEWLYNILGTRSDAQQNPNPDASSVLLSRFISYQKSLGLTLEDGSELTTANMLDEIRRQVVHSAEYAMNQGQVIPGLGEVMNGSAVNDWIAVDQVNKKVLNIDMSKYLLYVVKQRALKNAPSFDQTGLTITKSSGESNLFGTSAQVYSNFTEYAWTNNDVANDGIGFDDTGLSWAQYLAQPGNPITAQVKMVNPMAYIGTEASTAPYWYVRHGTLDRDTAFTVSLNLSRALAAAPKVESLDYRLAWNMGHAGNYDVPEAMAWVAAVLQSAGSTAR